MPRAMGTATISAMIEVRTVPKARAAMPNLGSASFGNQAL
jgi:hypothetical protein